jgi:hypothetical protein
MGEVVNQINWAQEPAMGSCEHGNEPSVSIKCCGFLGYLSNYWLLRKDSLCEIATIS